MPDLLPLDLALDTAREAGQLLRGLFGRHLEIGHKSTDIDLVTEADVASERLIVNAIREHFPQQPILSEEGLGDIQEIAGENECLWLIDPLDGTVNYAHGYPIWGVSLALADANETAVAWRVVMGVIHDPLRDETFWARAGEGAWCNGERIQVSRAATLSEALVATGFAYKRATLEDNNLAEFNAMMPRVQGVRRAGAAVLDLAHLAAGRLDGYWEMHLKPWDWAAGWLLVEEAGGRVSDLKGQPWDLGQDNMVASNGLLHQEMLQTLRR
jgi:myo-inositol-1(or 4)-monophosphatase